MTRVGTGERVWAAFLVVSLKSGVGEWVPSLIPLAHSNPAKKPGTENSTSSKHDSKGTGRNEENGEIKE